MFKRLQFAIDGRSSQWAGVRKKHLKSFPVCLACGTKASLAVHHIIPFKIDPSKELEEANLMTLCKHCHLVLGHLKDWDINNTEVKWLVNYFKILRKSGKKPL